MAQLRNQRGGRGRIVAVLIGVAVVVLGLVLAVGQLRGDSESSSGSAVGPLPQSCEPPPGDGELRDQDFDDDQLPWARDGQQSVPIYFEAAGVDEQYRGYLEQGAVAWSRSPCLDVQVVDRCPAEANCVTVSVTSDRSDDGNFNAVERGGFTTGGRVELNDESLSELGDGAKLNVTVHEMGHAVGLRHRLTTHVLMNGDTYTDVFEPDDIDYYNLMVLYGTQG